MRALCLTILAGCGIADFDIDQPVMEQRITGSPLPGPLAALFPLPLNVDLSAKIKAMDSGPIDSVALKSLELTITATAQPMGDWSFVDSVDVFVSSSKQGSTLAKVKLAHVTSPGKVTVMTFVPEPGVNLKPYIDEGSVVEGASTGRAPNNDVTYNGDSTFTVHPL
jgi:hypothetical protein